MKAPQHGLAVHRCVGTLNRHGMALQHIDWEKPKAIQIYLGAVGSKCPRSGTQGHDSERLRIRDRYSKPQSYGL